MLRCGPGLRDPPIVSRGSPHVRSRSTGRQGAGSPWSRMSGASPRHGPRPGTVAKAPFRQPLASGQDVRRAGRSKHSACRPHGPRRRGCKQPGGSAVRTGARGSGYSVRMAGSGVARLHSRTSTAPGSQHVVNTPQKQTFPSSFARPPRKLRIFTGCKASGIQPARCQNSQRGTRNSYCNRIPYFQQLSGEMKWKKDQNKIYRDRSHKAPNEKDVDHLHGRLSIN